MHSLLNKIRCFFLTVCFLAYSQDLWAVTIRIINQQINFDFSFGAGLKVLPIYQVQLGNGITYDKLPHSLSEECLIEAGQNDREVRFIFSGFDDDGYNELTLSEEVQDRFFQLLTNNPNTLLDRTMTCLQFCYFLKTGITQQSNVTMKYFTVKKKDIEPGDVVAMRDDSGKVVHLALYISHGIYISKFGLSEILFHTIQAADDFYGPGLHSSILVFKGTNSYGDNNHPPPDAGACGGASTSAY
ncbi:NlpC/P60 family protein [Endozoicomonas euniceicola]|uniref:NlpC/P60 domain-containing protein n=1 Tax=Endozoicomonas euniceicola TaxID=1234143 RepID=A0ABY6GSQ1_9GAMM|nr:hypothetical protein [Endozoicomonas euniceicola]UYM15091.1 hypothetical protein NX720_19800 [Endozoicomonas euniceicola]